MRFKTVEALEEHKKSLDYQTDTKSSGSVKRRDWYTSKFQWINEKQSNNKENNKNKANGHSEIKYRVISDEKFPRCPISQVKFEQKFDDDDEEYYYLSAIKIFVPDFISEDIYNLGKPCDVSDIRYLIISESVFESWQQEDRLASIKDTIEQLAQSDFDFYVEKFQTLLSSKSANISDFVLKF